jgi:tetratricopeptide (TPR) repeat protein
MRVLSIAAFLLWAALSLSAQNGPSLQDAAAAADAGRQDEAIGMYRALLQREPQNVEAMSALSRLLEASGRWRDAVPVLDNLVQLQPENSAALYQLGSMTSWESDQRPRALTLLRRACETSGHNAEYCAAYGEVLSWSGDTRMEAITQLRSTVSAHPEAVSPRLRLAQLLSWNESTRREALQVFDDGLKRDPGNVELLVASAQVLSWNGSTRPLAESRYDLVLKESPDDARALVGKAQLLAWHNHTAEALAMYRRVLAKDPKNPAALRGEAEILNWKGRYTEARMLATEAHVAAPADPGANLELARADIGLHKYAEARQVISGVTGNPGLQGIDETRQDIRRGLGTYLDLGYITRREQDLAFDRPTAALSTPVFGNVSRLTFAWQPTFYNVAGQGFNANYAQVALDSGFSDKLSSHMQIGAETLDNAPVNFDGNMDFRYKARPSTTLKFAFAREPIEESLLSTRGQNALGLGFLGQVRSNLADLGVSYYNNKHKFDVSLDYTDGAYTGRGLDANRRYGIEAQFGEAVHSDQPFIRLAYGVTYLSFDHDADVQTGVPLSRLTGGYFSPTKYLLNQGILNVSHRFSRRFEWGMTGAAGAQNLTNLTSTFSNTQFASSYETHALWRVTPTNEITLGYSYLNVYNAFQRNLYRVSWRHYF